MSHGLSLETIKKHAAILVRVHMTLKKSLPAIESDQLWQAIKSRWNEEELAKAVASFEKNGRIAAFKKLFDALPQAGADGFFEADGEKWGTIATYKGLWGISHRAIKFRVSNSPCRSRNGKDRGGHILPFYMFTDVKKACADLLKQLPKADVKGFFKADGEEWGTVPAYCRSWSVSQRTIESRISSCPTREGKSLTGGIVHFYALTDVKKACADLLQDLPEATVEGFLQVEGERWGMISAIARKLGLNTCATTTRVSNSPCRSRNGKDRGGHILPFYMFTDVKKACADLLKPGPIAGTDGFFVAEGKKWGTPVSLARYLGVKNTSIQARIRGLQSKRGKDSKRHPRVFYALSDVEKACADLLRKKRRRKN